jgi:hypothetical protein
MKSLMCGRVALSKEIRFPLWDTVTFTVLYVYTTTPYREDNPYPPCGDALGNYIASALTTVM